MTDKIKKDIIDNRRVSMGEVINSYLPDIKHLDVSTGYFDMNGYAMVRDSLERALDRQGFSFRLLMGSDSIIDKTPKSFEDSIKRITGSAPNDLWPVPTEDITPLYASLASLDLDSGLGAINGLRNMLRRDTFQVRCGKSRFNHSKCYILGDEAAIIGSSNFTRPGLGPVDGNKRYNYELNASLKQDTPIVEVQSWFDDMWDMSDDAKQDLISELERSKFGDPPKPFEIYLQMVFEKYKQRFVDSVKAAEDMDEVSDLAPFQTEAVLNAMQMIGDWGGAFISDSVGLGKTHIGLDIIRRKISERRRVLLVAPRQVIETVWKKKLDDTQFNVKIVGMEEMGRSGFAERIHEYSKIDVILIDESHGFRGGDSNRRMNMMKLVTVKDRQTILMSATPYNNTLMDIYHQLLIIAGDDENKFEDLGIPHMHTFFKNIIKQGMERGMSEVQPLLEAVMVRRTRDYIKSKYPDVKLGGRKIKFPKHRYASIRYTTPFSDIYGEVAETIKSLHMTPYGLRSYDNKLPKEERDKYRGVAYLQNVLLIKRFESSMEAVSISLGRMKRLYDVMFGMLCKNRIVSKKNLSEIMSRWDRLESSGREDGRDDGDPGDEQMFNFILKEMEGYDQVSADDYDMDAIMKHMKVDKERLNTLIGHINRVRSHDKKFEAVADRILVDGALEKDSRKVLLFTEYADTAKYVHKELVRKFPERKVLLLTGNTDKEKRRNIIQAFAPKANGVEDVEAIEQADILVSTEVLAEGQNLQDCNYIINYDLPWNPVRIVQRVGRLDRLTSEWDNLYSRQCFPEDQLNDQVDLKGIVTSKVKDISDLGLLDMDLLGVGANPKQFNETASRLKIIVGSDETAAAEIWQELEAEADILPQSTYLEILKKYANKEFVMRMSRKPLGRRSGIVRHGEPPRAVLAYTHKRTGKFYTALYRYDAHRAEAIVSDEAFKIMSCMENTPAHLPMDTDPASSESFRHMLTIDRLARDAIVAWSGQDRIARVGQRSRDDIDMNRIIKKAAKSGLISDEDGEFVSDLLRRGKLKPWYDWMKDLDDELDRNAAKELVNTLRRNFRTKRKSENSMHSASLDSRDLVLVGTMFVTDEQFVPGLYWSETSATME